MWGVNSFSGAIWIFAQGFFLAFVSFFYVELFAVEDIRQPSLQYWKKINEVTGTSSGENIYLLVFHTKSYMHLKKLMLNIWFMSESTKDEKKIILEVTLGFFDLKMSFLPIWVFYFYSISLFFKIFLKLVTKKEREGFIDLAF